MNYLIAEPRNYNDAIGIIAELSKIGIDSNVTIGGVRIYIESENEKLEAINMCEKLGIFWRDGGGYFA